MGWALGVLQVVAEPSSVKLSVRLTLFLKKKRFALLSASLLALQQIQLSAHAIMHPNSTQYMYLNFWPPC